MVEVRYRAQGDIGIFNSSVPNLFRSSAVKRSVLSGTA
jgi:hypothetical protein